MMLPARRPSKRTEGCVGRFRVSDPVASIGRVSPSLPPPSPTDARALDPDQTKALEHDHGPLLVTGGPGTGKSTLLRERFARLVESGADPERVALVVRSRAAAGPARRALLARLARPLPG